MRDTKQRVVVAIGLAALALLLLGGGILVGASPQFRSLLSSSVPPVMTYQGLLSDAAGNPLAGPYTMTFGLYDVDEGGAPLWTEVQSVTVTDGLFNIYLGATSPLSQTLFDGQDLYLGVAVGADDEMTPRTRVGSVPYAFTSGQVLTATCETVGLTDCGGQCVNIQTDRNHCSGCDQECNPGEICQGGICSLSCPVGQVACTGECIDPNTDRYHCGGCPGSECDPGYICVGGMCSLSCQSGLTECGGQCVNTQVDPNHCGGCGASCGGATPMCISGTCSACPSP